MLLCFAYPSTGPTVIYLILISPELWNGHIEPNCFCAVLSRFKKWIYKCPNLCLFLYFRSVQIQSFALFDIISILLNILNTLSKLLLLLIACFLRNALLELYIIKILQRMILGLLMELQRHISSYFKCNTRSPLPPSRRKEVREVKAQPPEIWVNVLKCVADQVFLEQQLTVQSPWRADIWHPHELVVFPGWLQAPAPASLSLLPLPWTLVQPSALSEHREIRYSIKPPIKEDIGFFFFFSCGREIVY